MQNKILGLEWDRVGEDGGLFCINAFSKFGLGLGLGLVHDFRTRGRSRTLEHQGPIVYVTVFVAAETCAALMVALKL